MIRSKVSGILTFMLTAVLLTFPAIPVLAASDGGGTPMANRWIALLTVLAIIALDTVLGILASLKQGEFDWRELPRFLQTAILPYIGGLLLLGLVSMLSNEVAAIFYAAAAATTAKFLAEIKDKVVVLFGREALPTGTDPPA
jgi:uncharacterized membrane protein YfcA